jgi:hypothetical protein
MFLAGGTQDARRHCLAGSGERVRPAQGQGLTQRDRGRQNRASIGGSAPLNRQGGAGKDTRLRSDCGQNLGLSRRVLEAEAAVYKVMCKAKDREAVVRMLFPAWSPDAIQHPFCPYNLWTLLEEGRFEDIAFAPSAEEQDVTPIPYGTEPAHA